MSGLRLKVKSQLDIWCLYKTSVSIGLTFFQVLLFWKNEHFKIFSNINALGIKFGLAVRKIKVNPDSTFVQTW